MINYIDKMDGWKIEELPKLVFFQEGPGVRKNQYTDLGIKLLNVANLKDGNLYLDNTNRYISEEEAYGKYSHFLVDEGDLIIASSGIKVEYFDKKMGFVKKEHLPLCMNTSTIRFKTLDDNILDIEYFAYFLKTNYFKKQIARLITGSAQLNFGPSHLKQIKVILPPIDVQKKIVKVLDKDQELIDKRKEQIEALDELVKSRFIEMFGDPVLNQKGWDKYLCKDMTLKIGSGATPKGGNSSYKEEGISLIRSMNVHNNKFVDKDLAFIDEEQAEKLKNVIIEENDVLLNITGASVARCCIVPDDYIPARVNQHVAILRCKCEQILHTFLCYQLTNQSYQRLLWDIATSGGATREAIIKQQIENLELIIPPIELQNQFADFVNQVDKLKFEMEKSLKELEDNFNSLMQRAFKRELFK